MASCVCSFERQKFCWMNAWIQSVESFVDDHTTTTGNEFDLDRNYLKQSRIKKLNQRKYWHIQLGIFFFFVKSFPSKYKDGCEIFPLAITWHFTLIHQSFKAHLFKFLYGFLNEHVQMPIFFHSRETKPTKVQSNQMELNLFKMLTWEKEWKRIFGRLLITPHDFRFWPFLWNRMHLIFDVHQNIPLIIRLFRY